MLGLERRSDASMETIGDLRDGKTKKKKKEEEIDVDKAKISFHVATIKKPQDEYNITVNNTNNIPFEHVWLEKQDDHTVHPLEKLSVMEFVDKNITEVKPVKPLPLDETPFKLVEHLKDLEDLAAKLSCVDEFAVDLEHNQYRSFQGLTCLMQISTRTEDFVVDTFKVWDHIGPCLREIFKDPLKKKVMHGADRDIIWLQRDFGIYVCNLFDTGQASRVLKLERFSLEFLLKKYCGVAANKQYQNADWRIRPLPDVMTRYAREDTHYLLYIYDLMRMDLHTLAKESELSDPPLVEVYKHSYDVCMQLYEKELFTGESYLNLYGVNAANFNAVQLSIVAGLYEWRDRIAREDDESSGYVLPNKILLKIAKEMPLHVGQLRRLLTSKLPYVERNFDAVVSVIRRSMQNAAAFEPVLESLKDCRPRTVSEKDIESAVEETSTEAVASSLLSKRKFESDNKAKEEVKVSKAKPNEVIVLVDTDDDDDDDDDETSETDETVDRVSEIPLNGPDITSTAPYAESCSGPDVIVLTDDDSDDDDDSNNDSEIEGNEMSGGKFMSLKPGFLNI